MIQLLLLVILLFASSTNAIMDDHGHRVRRQGAATCDPNPCNTGYCMVNPGETFFVCECPSDVTGVFCETSISPCFSAPCQKGGYCTVVDTTTFACTCLPGYLGSTCESATCTPNPCHNGAYCETNNAELFCECPVGYSGQYCEFSILIEAPKVPKTFCEPADILLVLDATCLAPPDCPAWHQVQSIAATMVGFLPVGKTHNRIGVVSYSEKVREDIHMSYTTSATDTSNLIKSLPPLASNTTNLASALHHSITTMFYAHNGYRPDIMDVVMIITPSRSLDVSSSDEVTLAVDHVQAKGAKVFGVAVGDTIDSVIPQIVSKPSEDFIVLGQGNNVAVAEEMAFRICDLIGSSLCYNISCQNGGWCQPDNLHATYTCQCQKGFFGSHCQYVGCSELDVALLLDTSYNVPKQAWPDLQRFTVALVYSLLSNQNQTLVSMATFGESTSLQFGFVGYEFMSTVDLMQFQWSGGYSNVAQGLWTVRSKMFTSDNGARQGAAKAAVVILGGASQRNSSGLYQEAIILHQTGVRVCVVSVGGRILGIEEKVIASDPNFDHIFSVDRYTDLSSQELADLVHRCVCTASTDIKINTIVCASCHMDGCALSAPYPVKVCSTGCFTLQSKTSGEYRGCIEEIEDSLDIPLYIPQGGYVCYPEPLGEEICFCNHDFCNAANFGEQGGAWHYHQERQTCKCEHCADGSSSMYKCNMDHNLVSCQCGQQCSCLTP